MEKALDNTIAAVGRREPAVPQKFLASAVLVLLAAGIASAVAERLWLVLIIFAAAFVLSAAFIYQAAANARRLKAIAAGSRIDWESAGPELQRQSLGVEVAELSKILETGSEQITDLQSAYIVAEDLALRQIQHEERVPLMRHVGVCGMPFDAVMIKDAAVVCADVCFLISPDLRQERIDAAMRKIERVKANLDEVGVDIRARLMLILITQLNEVEDQRLRRSLDKSRFSSALVDIDIRFLDFEVLQRIYISE